MSRRAKRAKKHRRVFNLYNLAILICLATIIGAVIILFEQDSTMIPEAWKNWYREAKISVSAKFEEWTTNKEEKPKEENKINDNYNNTNNLYNNIDINSTTNEPPDVSGQGEETEIAAKRKALIRFNELGETGITIDDLEFMKIKRQSEDYYYIASPSNSLEIKVSTGNITRVNSIPVDR